MEREQPEIKDRDRQKIGRDRGSQEMLGKRDSSWKQGPFASALEQKLVDENMVRIIASHQVLNGGIVDIFNNQRVTLKEAVEKRFISPELATLIQIDTLESSDHGTQIEKQDGIEVCELKKELLRKEMLTTCNQTAEMSCSKEESEKLFQIKSQSAQENVKTRVSDGEQAKKSRKISLNESQCKDQDERRAFPVAKDRDYKGNMEKDTNEAQEKIMPEIEIISHMKQSASGLDPKEIRENQGEIIPEAQESNCETSGKLLSEQVMQKAVNTKEKRKTEKEMIVEENVKTCKPSVFSKEKSNQETAIQDDGDASVKSQSMEITISEKEKETERELGFSIICKAEDSSSPMIPKGISVRNQDALPFFNSNQVSEGKVNLSLCLTLKPEENLSQTTIGGAQSESFSSIAPRPEGLHYKESVEKAQVADTSQISKTDKSFQGTTRQETNYYKDSCAISKSKETKDVICSSNEYQEKSYQEVPFDSTKALKSEITVSRVDPEEVNYVELSKRKDLHNQNGKSDSELCGILESKTVTTQEITGEKLLEMSESPEGVVTQGVPRVLAFPLPEKLFKDVSQKESTGQLDATISPTIPETSEERTMPVIYPTIKMDEKTPQGKLRESRGSEQTPFVTAPREKGNESVNPEPFRATRVSFPVVCCVVHVFLFCLVFKKNN